MNLIRHILMVVFYPIVWLVLVTACWRGKHNWRYGAFQYEWTKRECRECGLTQLPHDDPKFLAKTKDYFRARDAIAHDEDMARCQRMRMEAEERILAMEGEKDG